MIKILSPSKIENSSLYKELTKKQSDNLLKGLKKYNNDASVKKLFKTIKNEYSSSVFIRYNNIMFDIFGRDGVLRIGTGGSNPKILNQYLDIDGFINDINSMKENYVYNFNLDCTRHFLGENIEEKVCPLSMILVAHSKSRLKGNEDIIDDLTSKIRLNQMSDDEIKNIISKSKYEPKNIDSLIKNLRKIKNA
jgi:hypothetical protein